ncbi:MAG: GAF domain-containing protein [Chloroflexota bacterium]
MAEGLLATPPVTIPPRSQGDLGRLTNSSLRLEDVLADVVRAASELVDAASLRLWLVDDTGEHLKLVASAGAASNRTSLLQTVPIARTVVGRVLLEGCPATSADVQVDARWQGLLRPSNGELHGYLGVPLASEAGPLGVISVLRRDARVFSQDEIDTMRAFASQAAAAISNARAFEAQSTQMERLLALHAVSVSVLSNMAPSQLFDLIVSHAVGLVRAETGVLHLWDEDAGLLVPANTRKVSPEMPGYVSVPPGHGVAGRAFQERRVVVTNHYPEASGATSRGLELRLQAVASAPIVLEGRVLGVITVTHLTRGARFSNEDALLLELLAAQAAVAVNNARLYEGQKKLSERLMAIVKVSTAVVSRGSRGEVLRNIVEQAKRLVGAERGGLFLLDADQKFLRAAYEALDSEEVPTTPVLEADVGVVGSALRERRVIVANDYQSYEDARPETRAQGTTGIIAAPMVVADLPIGVIAVLTTSSTHRFGDDDGILMELLAAQAAVVLENSRLFDEVGHVEGLRELDRLKTEFLATVSHELRTPLSYIHGYAELLMNRGFSEQDVQEMAREIHRGSTSMVRLVDDLLDVSRIESGQFALQMAPTRLDTLLETVVHSFALESRSHEIDLKLPDAGLPRVLADAARIRQAIANMITNAVQFSAPGSQVNIRAIREEDHIRVEVQDFGVGIAQEEQDRVFERFYRGSQAVTSQRRGTGLGLAIVLHLIEAHGGQVGVTSSPGQGSTFWFTLPTTRVIRTAGPEVSAT